MMVFDARGRQVSDIQCVLFKGEVSRRYLTEFPARHAGATQADRVGLFTSQDWPFVNIMCGRMQEDLTKIMCTLNGYGIVCTVIADEMDRIAEASARVSVLHDGGPDNCIYVGGGYGGSLPSPTASTPSGSSSSGGTFSYTPPYGFGGGTLPGGSYEYEPPSGANCVLGGCGDGGDGGGQPCYETDRPVPRVSLMDCPAPCSILTDPNCIRRPNLNELQAIESAKYYLVDTTTMSGSTRRYECTLIGVWLKLLLESGKLFVGRYTDYDANLNPTHYGRIDNDTVHVDSLVFEAHGGDLLTTILHEAVHWHGERVLQIVPSHGGDTPSGPPPDYTLPFWRSIETSDPSQSCIKPY